MPRRHKFRKERIVDLTDAPETARNSGIIDIIDDDPPCQELFDPKVKYRLTTTRIRNAFSQNASVCRVFSAPTPPKPILVPDLGIDNASALAIDTIDDPDVTNSKSPDTPVAEWLMAIADFQKDVARYVAAPELRAELRDACRRGRCDNLELENTTAVKDAEDKIALLSDAAFQILTPHIASTGLNTPILSSTSSALVNGAAEVSIATEPDVRLYSKRRRMLEDHGVSEADVKAAATHLLDHRLLGDSFCKTMSTCAAGDVGPTLDGSRSNCQRPEPATATSNTNREWPQYEAEPAQPSTSTILVSNSSATGDEMGESNRAQRASASSLIASLLRKKGADALVEFLLSD
ncbi:hypothetical protein GGI24_001558 [Coemansia furcata]|nr:hypothetical protein GGI24_001558 [Coemansia furcata]